MQGPLPAPIPALHLIHWVAGTRGLVIMAAAGSSVLHLMESGSCKGPSGDIHQILTSEFSPAGEDGTT